MTWWWFHESKHVATFIIDNKLVVFWLNLLLEYLSENTIGMAPTKIIFERFFFLNPSRKIKVWFESNKNNGYLRWRALNVCVILPSCIILRMGNFSDKICRENQNSLLTLRRLMSYIYIYGAPILDVSRSHTTTQHSR